MDDVTTNSGTSTTPTIDPQTIKDGELVGKKWSQRIKELRVRSTSALITIGMVAGALLLFGAQKAYAFYTARHNREF